MESKVEIANDINNQLQILNEGSNRKETFYGLERVTTKELNIIRRLFDKLIEYQTGVIRDDNIDDTLLEGMVEVAKFAFINSPQYNRSLKMKCQRIIDKLGV